VISAFACVLLCVTAGRAGAQAASATVGDSVQCGDSIVLAGAVARTHSDSGSRYRAESFSAFALRTIGPIPLVRSAALAGFDQWRRRPVHWLQTSRGYRDRLDARVGGEILGHAIRFGFARAAQEQAGPYENCHCDGFEPRFVHALLTPFRVQTPQGVRYSALTPSGVVVSALVVTSVHPGGFSPSRGLGSGVGNITGAALSALAREFWPFRWRPPGF
jgi:hypothetical protein